MTELLSVAHLMFPHTFHPALLPFSPLPHFSFIEAILCFTFLLFLSNFWNQWWLWFGSGVSRPWVRTHTHTETCGHPNRGSKIGRRLARSGNLLDRGGRWGRKKCRPRSFSGPAEGWIGGSATEESKKARAVGRRAVYKLVAGVELAWHTQRRTQTVADGVSQLCWDERSGGYVLDCSMQLHIVTTQEARGARSLVLSPCRKVSIRQLCVSVYTTWRTHTHTHVPVYVCTPPPPPTPLQCVGLICPSKARNAGREGEWASERERERERETFLR